MSTDTATKAGEHGHSEACKKIYVGNLATNVTTEDLTQLFGLSATPYLRSSCSVELKQDNKGNSKGFAFINVPEHVCGDILKLHNIEFYEKTLVIEESKTAESGNKGGNKGRGGFRGRGRGNYRWRRTPRNKYAVPSIPADQKFDIIDGGANLTSPKFHKYYDYMLNRAREAGVTKYVITGLTLNGCKNAVIKTHTSPPGAFAAIGIHPHHSKDWNQATHDAIVDLVTKEKTVVAIGEVGLDYKKNYSDKAEMKEAFEKQCKIAHDYNKALLVHEREAFDDVKEILAKFNFKAPVVMYCMTGSTEQIKEYLNRGYYIGITGYLAKEPHGKHIREAIQNKELPLTKIMLHSDAPHMIPNMPNPDELSKQLMEMCMDGANEPCTLHATVRQIASLLSMTPKDVAQQLNKNASQIYKF